MKRHLTSTITSISVLCAIGAALVLNEEPARTQGFSSGSTGADGTFQAASAGTMTVRRYSQQRPSWRMEGCSSLVAPQRLCYKWCSKVLEIFDPRH